MAIKLMNETDILRIDFRQAVIAEIEGDENKFRKEEMLKRYDCYKDNTKKYVLDVYRQEQGEKAFEEIKYRATNISFTRAIVDKKSQLYTYGCKREAGEVAQEQIDQVSDLLNINTKMKKANRYEELFKNALAQVYAYPDTSTQKWKIKLNILPPFKYDVIEDVNDPETARVIIFSYYGAGNVTDTNLFYQGDTIDQTIADSPSDMGKDKKFYVWWSASYHFTTDEAGEVIPGLQSDDLLNPIGMLPFVNFSTEQDGAFWAIGGDDIVDGSILLNVFLTDLYYIAKYQGMGLFYLFGKGVPKNIKVGPSQAITMDVQEGDPNPQIGFATSNPPLDSYMNSIKEYVSALMKTNNLQPAGFLGFDSADATSGIQELIKRSELLEDQENKREIYRDSEPYIYDIYIKWHNLLLDRGLLDDEFAAIGKIPEDTHVKLKFNPAQSILSETEKLDIIQKRKDMGLDSAIDSIMRDNPELTHEDAEKKMMEILEYKVMENRMKLYGKESDISNGVESEGDTETDQESSTEGDRELSDRTDIE